MSGNDRRTDEMGTWLRRGDPAGDGREPTAEQTLALRNHVGHPVRNGSTFHTEGLIDDIADAGADRKSNDRKDHQRNENFNQSETRV